VGALGQPHAGAGSRRLQPPHLVDPGAGGVDHGARPHRESRAGAAVDQLGAGRPSRLDPQCHRFHVRGHDRIQRGRRLQRRQRQPAVVGEMVVVEHRPGQALAAQAGHPRARLVDRDPAASALIGAGQHPVQPDAGAHLPQRLRRVRRHRHHELERAHQVRRQHLRVQAPLAVGLAHQPQIAHGQIAQPAVQQLRGGRRGGTGQVAAVDHGHACAGPRRRPGGRGADDAGADHQHVHDGAVQPLQRPRPRPSQRHRRRLAQRSTMARSKWIGVSGFAHTPCTHRRRSSAVRE
jgi:hypothetical protein